jgi:hypothetical protein
MINFKDFINESKVSTQIITALRQQVSKLKPSITTILGNTELLTIDLQQVNNTNVNIKNMEPYRFLVKLITTSETKKYDVDDLKQIFNTEYFKSNFKSVDIYPKLGFIGIYLTSKVLHNADKETNNINLVKKISDDALRVLNTLPSNDIKRLITQEYKSRHLQG